MEELNASMEASAASWMSDLEMEDFDFFPQECRLNLLDVDVEEFLSHDIASALQGNSMQQSLSSECYSSYPTCTSKTLSNSCNDETSFEGPAKLLKTSSGSCNSPSITEYLSPKLSLSPSESQILPFENSNSSPANTTQFYGFDCTLNLKQNEVVSVSLSQLGNKHVSAQTPMGSSDKTKTSQGSTRSPADDHAQDHHIMAERKRREKLTIGFIALAALVPGLKKMHKASVIRGAIMYVKELKARLALLEEQSKITRVESVVVLNKPELCGGDYSSLCDESLDAAGAGEALLQVEAKVSEKELLLRILCQRQKGLLVNILAEIQSFHLFVVNSSALPFGDSFLDITIIAQMGEGYNLTIEDLVNNLREAMLKFMSKHERGANVVVPLDID